uniref:39S ribosomal protein L1, mitochondrial n=1 Tax=Magallana gigas TaxID=29159 RepID=A0A8W8MFF3_MAGGI
MAATMVQRLSQLRGISNFLTATTPMLVPACTLSKRNIKAYKDGGKEQKRVWAPRIKKTIFEEKKQDAEFLSRIPEDSIYLMELFPESEFSLQDAIKLQKDYADPFIMNNMDGVIYLDILCNMRTKKQTKFISEFTERLFFPNPFEVELPRRCLVICKTEEEALTAQRLGAVFAGDETIAQRLDRKKGDITANDYDIVLCTNEMQDALFNYRNLLKNNYPSEETFSLDNDVEKMMLKQKESVSFTCRKEGSLGRIQIPIGQLNLEIDQITENYDFFFSTLLKHPKVAQVRPGENFVTSARLLVPPCPEQLKLKDEELRRIDTPANKRKAPQKDSTSEKVDSDSFTGDLLMSA